MTIPDANRNANFTKALFLAASALQTGCGVVFVWDVLAEWTATPGHPWFEALAVVALAVGAAVSFYEYFRVVQRNSRVESELQVASGEFQQVIEQHFDDWGLTAAERDVALLSIKGVSMADIAAMRSSREGTIKAQSAAIYRKAGVSSRAELISVVIEDMISGLGVAPRTP